MYKITIPQSNSNDDFVFISEWKFKNNDFVKKGDHVLSIETSKVVEEVVSEHEGYLEILHNINEKLKVGEVAGYLNESKKEIKKKVDDVQAVDNNFTNKAIKLINKHSLDKKIFKNKKTVRESDVIDYLSKNAQKNTINEKKKDFDQLIILIKDNKPYHAAIYIKDIGIIDLSLLGSKIEKIEEYNFAGCKCNFYNISISKRDKALDFLKKPALLTDKIIKKEKSTRGWFTKIESANYILEFRDKRSKNSDDMNCIEWIVYGLEVGGIKIPNQVLTAERLNTWANENLKRVDRKDNLQTFQKFY